MKVSDGFVAFGREAPTVAQAWMQVNQALDGLPGLDPKTAELAYLAVLAAVGMQHGVEFHASSARQRGATREEVIGAVLAGLPAVGHRVVEALPAALRAFDAD